MGHKVIHDKNNQQFITTIEGGDVYLRYSIMSDNRISFDFTYTPPELRGNGLAAIVVRAGFKYAEENNLKIIPACPYIYTFLERYPEYNKFVV
ncbi:MAG: GNAT family N-acetyltransferase [Ignavibacteriaceae bacterium]